MYELARPNPNPEPWVTYGRKKGLHSRVAVTGLENIGIVDGPKPAQAARALGVDVVAVLWSQRTVHGPG
jgi:hypothetical protein